MPDPVLSPDALALQAEAQQLLFWEAALLDARDFDGWLALFDQDATYWVPSGADDTNPSREVSLVYDRLPQMRERVWRIDSGLAYAQEPASRTTHLVANVQVVPSDDELVHVDSAFVVAEFRRDRQLVHAGRYRHHLRRGDEGLRIVLKKVELVNNDGHLGNLSLIL